MAYSDIQKLRQQYIFTPIDDISMGGMQNMEVIPQDYQMPIEAGRAQQPATSSIPVNQQMPQKPTSGAASMGSPTDPRAAQQAMIDSINQIYTPVTEARDRNSQLLNNVPERQDPSFARRLVASGMGFGSKDPIADMEKVMYSPHMRNMADWTAKTEPFSKAEQLENTANINERTLAGNVVNAGTQQARIASQERIADEKNRISEIRAKAYDFKQRGYTIKVLGDEVVGFSPDGKRVSLGSSGGLDEADKIRIEGEWDVKAAEARGASAVKTAQAGAAASGRDLVTIDGVTYRRTEDGGFTPASGLPKGTPTRPGTPSSSKSQTDTPTEAKNRRQQVLRSVYENNPTYQDLFVNRAGVLELKPRPKEAWLYDTGEQKSIERWDTVNSMINPGYKPPTKETAKPAQGLSPTGVNTPSSSGGRGGGGGLGPTNTPASNGRGGGSTGKTEIKREYSKSRNMTRVTYSDGTTTLLQGK